MIARPTRHGLSLVELLIVMATLSLLATLAIPSYVRSVALARRTMCQSNLHMLHQAYSLRKSNEMINRITTRVKSEPLQPGVLARPINREAADGSNVLEAYGWAGALRGHTGNSNGAFQCPSDARAIMALPEIRMRVWGSGGAEHADYDINMTNVHPYWEYGSAADCDPQPGIWKVADHDPFAFPENRNNIDQLPQYDSTSNPNEFWLLVETARYGEDYHAGGDLDYNDIVFKVTVTATEVAFEAYQFWDGQTYNLVGPNGQTYGDRNLSVGQEGTRGPFTFAKVSLSYGMNSQVVDLSYMADRVLLVDYEAEVCYTGADVGVNDGWQALKAPRHLGRCNTVLARGDIGWVDPDQIDPEASDANYQTYWAPLR